jgi:hypothetical protein
MSTTLAGKVLAALSEGIEPLNENSFPQMAEKIADSVRWRK